MAKKLMRKFRFLNKSGKKMGKETKTNQENQSENMDNQQEKESTILEDIVDNEDVMVEDGDSVHEVESLKEQLKEQKDKFLRLFAEFENYKKRTIKEKLDLIKTASQDTLSSLLPVLDDFDRAKKNAEAEGSKEQFSEGIQLVYHKMYQVLKSRGLEPMESTGQVFDPELHEALTEIPAPTDALKGKVIDTIEKGYFLNDKLIRHAKVVVGK